MDKPVSATGGGNGRGKSEKECIKDLLKIARQMLWTMEPLPCPDPASFLLGETYILDALIKGRHLDNNAVALLKPIAEVCAWPQEAACNS